MRFFILLLMMFVLVMPSAAQDEAQPADPLEGMLSLMPGTMTDWQMISYVDFDNVIAARPNATAIQSWSEFESLEDGGIVMAAIQGINSGPQFLQYAFGAGERIPEVMGFDFFDIFQAVEIGIPPGNVIIVNGEFDVDSITTAHETRGFVAAPLEGYTLLCGADGCDSGLEQDLRGRDTANLFGGSLGRSQPILLAEDHMLSTTSYDMVQAIALGEGILADDPHIQTLMDVINATDGLFMQTWLMDGTTVPVGSVGLINPRLTGEQATEIRERLAAEFEAFPRFNLVMVSDHATETEQIVNVILTYENADDAQLAADVIPRRIEAYESIAMTRPFLEMIEERGATYETSVFTSERSGYSAAVITFRAPLASNEPSDGSRLVQSSVVYRLLVNGVMMRDLGWLSPEWE